MAEIIPFKGLRYNLQKIGSYDRVIAPPYDVISKKMQDNLYLSSEHNVVRLIHNRVPGEARYTEAADSLNKWQEQGVLVQDNEPAIYVYEQDFEFHGQRLQRKGFIAALKLKPLGEGLIYPHERTMSRHREDRLQLIRATRANLSPIFALYIDGNEIKQLLDEASVSKPAIKANDLAGVTQKLWLLKDKGKITLIQKAMKGKELFIADGHHRYETSLMYQQEANGRGTVHRASTDYTMMMFIDMDDEGVVIKPAHRIVKTDSMPFQKLLETLKLNFIVRDCSTLDEILQMLKENRDKVVFGLSDGLRFMFITYKGKPEFDLVILHRELERVFGINNEKVQDYISFSDNPRQALNQAGDGKVVFFVNPTPIETVKKMARAHKIMPQKSTYFYPKLTDGLVIRKLN